MGRKALKGAPSQPPLTAEERALLTGPFDVDAYERFLESMGVGATNRKSCVRDARRLQDPNQGLKYKRSKLRGKPAVRDFENFSLNETITMATDFHELKEKAFEWCPFDEDAGNGWVVNHPFNRLMDYQRHVLDQRKAAPPAATPTPAAPPPTPPAPAPTPPVVSRKRPVPSPVAPKTAKATKLAPILTKQTQVQGKDPTMYKPPSYDSTLNDSTTPTVTTTTMAVTQTTKRAHEAPNRRAPPSDVQKLLRTAARIPPLIRYLKLKKKFAFMNKAHWSCIRQWAETESGVEWLRSSGLDPLSFHLHHVKAYERGGLNSVYNCVFAPGSPNGWWGERDSEEMRTYIGDEACNLSDRHAKWVSAQAARGVDQTNFHPDFA